MIPRFHYSLELIRPDIKPWLCVVVVVVHNPLSCFLPAMRAGPTAEPVQHASLAHNGGSVSNQPTRWLHAKRHSHSLVLIHFNWSNGTSRQVMWQMCLKQAAANTKKWAILFNLHNSSVIFTQKKLPWSLPYCAAQALLVWCSDVTKYKFFI